MNFVRMYYLLCYLFIYIHFFYLSMKKDHTLKISIKIVSLKHLLFQQSLKSNSPYYTIVEFAWKLDARRKN